ncbi:MAG TPA: sigma-54-dependent Fis family transcriptional regulator [Deltaproteobacteria bacterium]|nr:sigma-54-dependent Fis family transcriptional regulator [Deltaproteobacteria bacterium]HIJ39632.1 sigma-54-dependent Fis family transcriptional regulator [Deltaproteobacteria bacterium]
MVDDDKAIRASMSRVIKAMGLHVDTVEDGNTALKVMAAGRFDIVFLDYILPDVKGAQILGRIHELHPETVVMMMTAYPAVEDAVLSMKLGVVDYLVKPFRLEDVENYVFKCLDMLKKRAESAGKTLSTFPKEERTLKKILGDSDIVRKMKETIHSVASTDSTILISGESGTGKELAARAIHELSPRADKHYVPLDCSSLVETLLESELFGHVRGAFTGADGEKTGLFEIADKGTFFFDEVSNLTMKIQCKLLRVIQEREYMKVGSQKRHKVDIRIISASNIDLEHAVKRGTFRNDLYYRINVVPIHLPPLRERKEDIPILLEHYLKEFNTSCNRNIKGFSEEAMEALMDYPYPGNIRELKHLVEQVVVLNGSTEIAIGDLPPTITRRKGMFHLPTAENMSLEALEKIYILFILNRTKGLRGQAADILGINRKTLSQKIAKYGIRVDDA